jgi:hypothetical protein
MKPESLVCGTETDAKLELEGQVGTAPSGEAGIRQVGSPHPHIGETHNLILRQHANANKAHFLSRILRVDVSSSTTNFERR